MNPGSSLTIVAIPEPDDITWTISSEKVPHMTICFLGDQSKNTKVGRIQDYLEHAASLISRFGVSVDHRGLLGEHDADVLFFGDSTTRELKRFRSHLLMNDDIAEAYNSTKQYSGWTPHLTLGYPETPANPDDRDYKGIHWVNFDRLALWTGDYDGPEFLLKSEGGEVSMGQNERNEALEHFGIKGMHWGVRKTPSDSGPESVTITQKKPGASLKAKGGRGHGPNEDALSAVGAAQKAKKSGLHSLSNQELQALVSRMNLEQQYVNLKAKEPSALNRGTEKIKKLLAIGKTVNEVRQLATSPIAKDLHGVIKSQLKR